MMPQYHLISYLIIGANIRDNNYKLLNHMLHYDLQKHFLLYTLLVLGTTSLIQLSMLT